MLKKVVTEKKVVEHDLKNSFKKLGKSGGHTGGPNIGTAEDSLVAKSLK